MPKPTTKSRQELRSRFVRNAIPTEADFADLIDAGLNQADDGLLRLPDQTLGLARPRVDLPVLRLFADPAADTSAWQLQLIGSDRPGLGLSGTAVPTALYLDGGTGQVGIGTTTPAGRLTVSETSGTAASPTAGSLLLDHEDQGGASSLVFRSRADRGSDYAFLEYRDKNPSLAEAQAGLLTIGIQNDANDHLALMPSGNVGIGTTTPGQKLTVQGAWNAGKDSDSGLTNGGLLAIKSSFPQLDFIDTNPNQGDWAIHVENSKLHFVRQPWNSTDLVLDGAGNVGVGTDAPAARLHVAGSTLVDSDLTVRGTLQAPGGVIRRVWMATGNGVPLINNTAAPSDEINEGVITSRYLKMTKKFRHTALRILYSDTFRSCNNSGESQPSSARWEIRINQKSQTPPIVLDRYQSSGNLHIRGTLVGYARGLEAGVQEIQVWVMAVPGLPLFDAATGWHASTWCLEAEEVLLS
jgi:hypothetical protein